MNHTEPYQGPVTTLNESCGGGECIATKRNIVKASTSCKIDIMEDRHHGDDLNGCTDK